MYVLSNINAFLCIFAMFESHHVLTFTRFQKASTTKFLHENRNLNRKIQYKRQDVKTAFCGKEKSFNVSVYGMPVDILFG